MQVAPQATVIVAGQGSRPSSMMSPMDAVKSCLKGSLSFSGRASRSEYWWFVLFYQLVSMGLTMVAGAASVPAISMATLLLIPAALSAAVRRMHDHGKSGWFILIPFYNLYLMIIDGESTENAHGSVPTNTL